MAWAEEQEGGTEVRQQVCTLLYKMPLSGKGRVWEGVKQRGLFLGVEGGPQHHTRRNEGLG